MEDYKVSIIRFSDGTGNIKIEGALDFNIWVCNSKYIAEGLSCKNCGHSTYKFIYVPEKYKIAGIDIFITKKRTSFTYYTKEDDSFLEDDCFSTKQKCQKRCNELNKEE
jgi:hypothetical protein